LDVDAWPDPKQYPFVDDAPIQGRVITADPGNYRVVVYALTTGGWSLQGVTAIDSSTGKWLQLARLGPAYAAMLVRNSFVPEPHLKSLPPRGEDIFDVKKSD
jgi:hypothetical protein